MKKIILICFVVYFSVIACKPLYIKQGIVSIDSLATRLNETRIAISSLDTFAIQQKYSQYSESIKRIKNFPDDNFNSEEWKILGQYGQIRKPLKNFTLGMKGFYTEAEYSTRQLENLKFDLKNKLLSPEIFEEYFKKEKDAVQNFISQFQILHEEAVSQLNSFDTLYPKVLVIIDNHYNK